MRRTADVEWSISERNGNQQDFVVVGRIVANKKRKMLGVILFEGCQKWKQRKMFSSEQRSWRVTWSVAILANRFHTFFSSTNASRK